MASSDDGTKLVALGASRVYTSTDSGLTWAVQASAPIQNWAGVASSADGNTLLAYVNNNQLYTSTDSGATWTARDSNRSWHGLASSADGRRFVAVALGDQIYTSTIAQTSPGIAGSVSGGQFDALELQYVGNGLFSPLSFSSPSNGFVAQ